jgi:DNA-directed RNA polymerase subunit N (RpoN/RPB10)
MLYLTCPTCGYFLGQKVLEYETNKTLICNNPKLSVEEKDIQLSKLIINANLRRYCCKMRLMTYKDIVQDILSVPTNE